MSFPDISDPLTLRVLVFGLAVVALIIGHFFARARHKEIVSKAKNASGVDGILLVGRIMNDRSIRQRNRSPELIYILVNRDSLTLYFSRAQVVGGSSVSEITFTKDEVRIVVSQTDILVQHVFSKPSSDIQILTKEYDFQIEQLKTVPIGFGVRTTAPFGGGFIDGNELVAELEAKGFQGDASRLPPVGTKQRRINGWAILIMSIALAAMAPFIYLVYVVGPS